MQILDVFSQPLYTCVCMHLGCKSTIFGGPYYEADQWLGCWLSYGSMLVRNRKRVSDTRGQTFSNLIVVELGLLHTTRGICVERH